MRKQHNSGFKHKANVRAFFLQFEQQQTEDILEQKMQANLLLMSRMSGPGFAGANGPPLCMRTGNPLPPAGFNRPPGMGMGPPGMGPPSMGSGAPGGFRGSSSSSSAPAGGEHTGGLGGGREVLQGSGKGRGTVGLSTSSRR